MCLGIPMEVVALIPPDRARVEAGSVSTEVSLQLVENVSVGDYVIVHAGFAIQVMDLEAAEETYQLLNELAEAEAEMEEEAALNREAPRQ
ncbi:MAG: hypothetical protein B1H03_03070 [Planctomycetales bacterium 4484_113]|nr:MAG: hypothetical protein B1H03_03070 [Planctomycetales bacterium 4484_113]